MTDMRHKPNGWNEPLNRMTEEEWKEYFRLREELDVEMSDEELKASLLKVNTLLKTNKKEEAKQLMFIIPKLSIQSILIKRNLINSEYC